MSLQSVTLSSFQTSFQNNRRITVRLGAAQVGGTSCPAAGTGSLAEMSCALAIHCWGCCCALGEVVPVSDCSHCKIFFSRIKMKPLTVQLVPVVPALSMWLLLRREPPPLYSHPFSNWHSGEVLPESPLGWEDLTPLGSPLRQDLQPSDGLCGPTLHPFSPSSSVVTYGDQSWAQYCRVAWWALSETHNSFVFKSDWSLRASYPRNVTLERSTRWGARHKVACLEGRASIV